jgi:hypothetical protein
MNGSSASMIYTAKNEFRFYYWEQMDKYCLPCRLLPDKFARAGLLYNEEKDYSINGL